MSNNVEKINSVDDNTQMAQQHPLEDMPSFEEHMCQLEVKEQLDAPNYLPRTQAVESVTYANQEEVHLEPTDLSLNPEEEPNTGATNEVLLDESIDQSKESDLSSVKRSVGDIMKSTYESRINQKIASENPEFYEKISEIKNSLYYDSDGEKPSEDTVKEILSYALPFLEQYATAYEQTKEQLNAETRKNRIQKSEERKIYNLLHKEENDRLSRRKSLYSAYDLSESKSIPDEYIGLSFEEVKRIEQEKQSASEKRGIFSIEENNTTPVKNEVPQQKMDVFYDGLNIPKNEQRYPEAVKIYEMVNWETFPDSLETAPLKEGEKSEKTRESIERVQSFGRYAKEKPPDEFGSRDVGVDDRLKLGDRYNGLISDYEKIANRRKIAPTQSKVFCHELASIIHDYEEEKEIWEIIGKKSLNDALDAYADINGENAVIEDLGAEIPEQIDRYTIAPLIAKINNSVRHDWQERITPIESYQEDGKYSLICSRVKEPFNARESRNGIFSGSLLTDSYHEMIGDDASFGFVLSPDHIIAAAPYDMYTYNWGDNDETCLRSGVPVVMSYQKVLQESQQNKTYSEIITRDLPVGIFYVKNKINEKNRKEIEKLAKLNPELPIVAL